MVRQFVGDKEIFMLNSVVDADRTRIADPDSDLPDLGPQIPSLEALTDAWRSKVSSWMN